MVLVGPRQASSEETCLGGTWEWGDGVSKIYTRTLISPIPDPLKQWSGLGMHASSARGAKLGTECDSGWRHMVDCVLGGYALCSSSYTLHGCMECACGVLTKFPISPGWRLVSLMWASP